MIEDPVIIEMNIAHYEALLQAELDDGQRSLVQKLLAEAKKSLMLVGDLQKSLQRRP